jgi:hypothetical protein
MSYATPELGDLLQAAAEQSRFELHTAMPGQITAIYSGEDKLQFADVLPCLRRQLPTEVDNPAPLVDEDLPILPRVPIAFVQGGGWFISVPMKVGDFVLVVFAERSIDRWIATAKKSSQATISPGDVGMHTLDGAIALPVGPAPKGELLQGVSASELVIGKSGGILISMSDSLLQLGAISGTDFVALAGKTKTELDSFKSDITTLKSAIGSGFTAVGVAMAANGPAGKTAFDSAAASVPHSPASVAATKVKAI